jgi:hypothetical protein
MSQKSSLPQPIQSVSRVLTADSRPPSRVRHRARYAQMQPLDLRGVPPTVLFWEKGTAMTKPGPKLTPVVCVAIFMVFTALRRQLWSNS